MFEYAFYGKSLKAVIIQSKNVILWLGSQYLVE